MKKILVFSCFFYHIFSISPPLIQPFFQHFNPCSDLFPTNQQIAGLLANQNQHIQQIPQNQNGYEVYSHYQVCKVF